MMKEVRALLSPFRLLYVEDETAVREELGEFLGRFFTDMRALGSAEEALEALQTETFDIALLDLNLPGMDGLSLAERIRGEDRDIRIIMMTAYTDRPFLLKAVELELTRYLVKPVTGEELLEALQKAAQELQTRFPKLVELGEGFRYDQERKCLLNGGTEVTLRRKEMELLEFFLAHPARTLTYEVIQYEIWPEAPMTRDAVRAQIKNLRKKTYPGIIQSVSGIGYRLGIA
jgi:two-component system response regulator VanR